MRPIVTITLNPALDLSSATDLVVAGPKLRCEAPRAEPGGGGINVARAIAHLGGAARAFVALGGSTGARLEGLLAREGIEAIRFDVPGETRQSIAISQRVGGGQFRFVMPGPLWDAALSEAALAAIGAALPAGALVVLSGSQPPGTPDDFAARLQGVVAGAGAELILDTSGAPLAHMAGAGARPFVLRMDDAEAEALARRALPTRAETAAFCADLIAARAAEVLIVGRGADGSTLVTAKGAWHCARAVEHVKSAVGAGDSFVGGFTLALARGAELPEALRQGTAAASAACVTEGTQLCTKNEAEAMLAGCALSAL